MKKSKQAPTLPLLIAGIGILVSSFCFAGSGVQRGSMDNLNIPASPRNGASVTDEQRVPWSNTDAYQDCGLACLYEKGNENLSTQAIYLLDKVNEVAGLDLSVPSGQTAGKDEARAKALLGGYCYNKSGKDLEECRDRYVRLQAELLKKIANAIDRNTDSASRFKDGKNFNLGRDVPVFAVLDGNKAQKSKKPQTPYVPTLAELRAQYAADSAAIQNLVSSDYEKWAASGLTQPEESDFVVMHTVPRDPGNPNSGTMTIVDTNRDGSPKIDRARYNEALLAWKQNLSVRQQDLKELHQTANQITLDKQALNVEKPLIQPGENADLFLESRKPVVEGANRAIQKAGLKSTSTVSFPGSSSAGQLTTIGALPRSPASAKGGPAKLNPDDMPANEPVARKDKSDFVTIVFPPDQIRKEVDNLIKSHPTKKFRW